MDLAKYFYADQYTEIFEPISLWRWDLGPRPNDLPTSVATPDELLRLEVVASKAKVKELLGNVIQASERANIPAGPPSQVCRGGLAVPIEEGPKTRASRRIFFFAEDGPLLIAEPIRHVKKEHGKVGNSPPTLSLMSCYYLTVAVGSMKLQSSRFADS